MNKPSHEVKSGNRSKYNAQLFGTNTRVIATHPLRLNDADHKKPEYQTKKAGSNSASKKHYSDAIKEKASALERLIKDTITGLPEKFSLKLCENNNDQVLLWSTIPFNTDDEKSLRLSQQVMQKIVEPLQSFGARYGRSPNAWLLLFPNFEALNQKVLMDTFLAEHALSWTRLSHQITTISAVKLPSVDVQIRPITQAPEHIREKGRPEKDILGTTKVPTKPNFFNVDDPTSQPTAEAIKLLTTIKNDQQRVEAAERLNIGKPTVEDTGMLMMQHSKGVLMYNIFLNYIKEQQHKTIPYSVVRNNSCLHHNIRLDAEATMRDAQCTASEILMIDGLNPGIGPIFKKCELAAEKTLKSCTVLMDDDDKVYCDKIYRVHGSGHNLSIALEDINLSNTAVMNLSEQIAHVQIFGSK